MVFSFFVVVVAVFFLAYKFDSNVYSTCFVCCNYSNISESNRSPFLRTGLLVTIRTRFDFSWNLVCRAIFLFSVQCDYSKRILFVLTPAIGLLSNSLLLFVAGKSLCNTRGHPSSAARTPAGRSSASAFGRQASGAFCAGFQHERF